MTPLQFIRSLHAIDVCPEQINSGHCFRFARIMERLFPGGEIVMNDNFHAAYRIHGRVFDVSGQVSGTFVVMTARQKRRARRWQGTRDYS